MICQGCHDKPATLHLTDRSPSGVFQEGHYCEPCYHALSEQKLSEMASIPIPKAVPFRGGIPLMGFLPKLLKTTTTGLTDDDVREIVEETVRLIEARGGALRDPRP
jgi:hypothetical protein